MKFHRPCPRLRGDDKNNKVVFVKGRKYAPNLLTGSSLRQGWFQLIKNIIADFLFMKFDLKFPKTQTLYICMIQLRQV